MLKQLRDRLQKLHRDRGAPSYKDVERRTAGKVSANTVGRVLRCERLPRAANLELVVNALGGDWSEFQSLWCRIRQLQHPLDIDEPTLEVSDESVEYPKEEPVVLELTTGQLDAAVDSIRAQIADLKEHHQQAQESILDALDQRTERTAEINRLRKQLENVREESATHAAEAADLKIRIADLETERAELTRQIETLEIELTCVDKKTRELLERADQINERRVQLYFEWARDEESRRLKVERALANLAHSN